ncbi:hypothetical protein INT43_003602 [Umbelopsis isabellina]|uniref:Uncharacterized protein n=1 Tax=Mortierella isabellina TaxID=91625 RepID=A0A8H7PSP2_MORIS|nr:hypothetical protein INT43_003602 [Umbelopsis isabellina]
MAKCCCCLPLRLGALLIAIWFVVNGTTASAALIVQEEDILDVHVYLIDMGTRLLAWIMTLACFAMSVINAGLIFWYKDQYLGKCNNEDYLSKYFNVQGDTEEQVLQACQKYFQNVAIASIITTVILGIMNIAFAVKLTQWLVQTRRDRNEANRVREERDQREREEAAMASSGKPPRKSGFFDRFRGTQNGTQNTAQVGPSMSETGGPKADINGANYSSGNAGDYSTGNASNV